jgi:hypothetical protein
LKKVAGDIKASGDEARKVARELERKAEEVNDARRAKNQKETALEKTTGGPRSAQRALKECDIELLEGKLALSKHNAENEAKEVKPLESVVKESKRQISRLRGEVDVRTREEKPREGMVAKWTAELERTLRKLGERDTAIESKYRPPK